jgi:hypothetical protein
VGLNKKKNKYKRQYYYKNRGYYEDEPTIYFNIKLFLTLIVILSVLLMKKYDFSVGKVDVDTIYDVVYYNEDFKALPNKVLKIGSSVNE